MRITILISLLCILAASIVASDLPKQPIPFHPVNTYSIIAYDSATGEFGAAVQSHYFKVADVIWLEPGIGAVATQSLVEFSYGPLGLEMMKNGKSAKDALAGLLASDPDYQVRQVAMIDRNGDVSVHTGSKCIAEAGHQTGRFFSVQANLMRNNTVWPAMAQAFETTKGDLADRMMAALEAAQLEGGDIRGMQSAAMVVVSGKPTGMSWKDRTIDIRVDDSPQPLVELKRLLNISRAYRHMDKGDELITAKRFDEAGEEYKKASELAPGNPEILFWYAQALVMAGELERSLPFFKEVFSADESWRVLVPRLMKSDLLPNDEKIISKILSQ